MRIRITKATGLRTVPREGWDLIVKDFEMKRENMKSRARQRHISQAIAHRLPRSFRGHS